MVKKVDKYVPRQYEDTFAGTPYSMNLGENQGSIAAVPLWKCTLRHEPRIRRQTPEEQIFWEQYLKR